MKLLLVLAFPLLAPSAAPRPAWDVAPRWVCEMTKLRVCDGLGGKCELKANDAKFRIDFPAGQFRVDIDPRIEVLSRAADKRIPFTEAIVGRHWLAPANGGPGFSKLVLDTGDSVTLSGTARAGQARDAIATRAQIDSQYLFYGTCRPDEATP